MPVLPLSEIERIFGKFSYEENPHKRGMILIDPEWVAQHIVVVKAGGYNVRCHELIAESVHKAFEELRGHHLLDLVDTYDGCYVPRHVLWNPKHSLSHHAWGIALDLNAQEYPYGSLGKQDARLTAIFNRHGFSCGERGGGLFRETLDPMHFEYTYIKPEWRR